VITLKVQFFLTDVLSPEAGNMVLVPGSHRLPFPEAFEEFEVASGNTVQIHASAGDAVLFPWSLWHGASANHSGHPRISVVLRYAQLWARPVDYQVLDARTLGRMTPRRRRLFGDLGPQPHPGDYYRPPTDEYLSVILGSEWAGEELSRRYRTWETFSTALYSTDTAPRQQA
jgi:ectoine hydroxylase-related dioxygenase (phytanoyl-CoA dioxygenase family)